MSLNHLKDLLLSLILVLSVYSKLTHETKLEVDDSSWNSAQEARRLTQAHHGRWTDRESMESENNVIRESAHKSQQDYICGRAVANNKYKEILLKDQSYQVSLSRTKYRPIEIRMPRIIGGDETTPGEFPWAASIKLNNQPICGGSLIDRSWILTAAHCVVGYNPKNLTVRLGGYRIKDTSETQTVDLPINMFIVHKDYSIPRPFSNDIALLKLREPVEYTDFIIPICLPTEDLVSTSSSTLSVNDYSNKYETLRGDSSGIVISTKMSDSEIAKCFNKLEQNYLNSIGIGPIPEDANSNEKILHSPSTSGSSSSSAHSNKFYSHESHLKGPVYIESGEKNQEHYNKVSYIYRHQQQEQPMRPTEQHFETPFAVNSYDRNNYIYYGLPWNRRSESGQDEHLDKKSNIKLNRLPINNELLREIQSIGSGPMPSLSLQQSDFAAISNDLSQSSHVRERPADIFRDAHINAIEESTDREADDSTKYSGLSGIVVGWGWVRELDGEDQVNGVNNKGYPSVTLQKVKLPILRNSVCEAWFQSQSKKITLLPSQFCAGFNSGGKDACRVS